MGLFWRLCVIFAFIIGLSACAHFDNSHQNRYAHLRPMKLDVSAKNWFSVLSHTRAGARSDKKRGKDYGPEISWTDKNILEWSEAAAIRGIRNGTPKNITYDYLSKSTKRLGRLFEGQTYLQDYIERSEWPLIARATSRADNDALFDLEILNRFTAFDVPEKISVTNISQGHFGPDMDAQSHKVKDGDICLFFLSPTYTRYRHVFPLEDEITDPHVRLEAFPRFCEQKNGRYTRTLSGAGEPVLFRADILEIYPPVTQNTQRPTHLPKTNNIAMRGEWDIVQIDDDRLGVPIGYLSINEHRTDLRLSCMPNLYGTKTIIDGRFISDYDFRYINDQIRKAPHFCANSPGNKFAKSMKDGTFYGDRQTIWFKGPHISFIAKRTSRAPSKRGWHNSYKYLSVEACLLDHPNIGADKYAGFGWVGRVPNHSVKFSLVGDGGDYWTDCKPDYELGFVTVDHTLPFLEAKAQEIKADIAQYGTQHITGGWVNQRKNSIAVNVEPEWAKDNQPVINQLKQKYPYIELEETLEFDEVLVTSE